MNASAVRCLARALFISSCLTALPAQDPPTTATDGGLRERVLAVWDARCRAMAHTAVTTRFDGYEPGETVHCELTVDARGVISLDTGHGFTKLEWRDFYGRTQTWMDRDQVHVNWPNKRMIETAATKGVASFERLAVLFWLRGSGIWTLPDEVPAFAPPEFFGSSVSLRHVLRDPAYEVREVTDPEWPGERLVALDRAGHDEILLGPAPHHVLLRRTWLLEGRPAMQLRTLETCDDPVAGRLPRRFTVEAILDANGVDYDARTAAPVEIQVVAVTASRTPSEVPVPTTGPGWIRLDRQTGTSQQVVAGGLDMLEAEADLVASAYADRVRRLQEPAWWRTAAGWCTLLAVVALIATERRKRSARPADIIRAGTEPSPLRSSPEPTEERLG